MPTSRQLEIFCEAAADCSFRVTADRLGMSQSAVSDHIGALERHLKCKLFIRRRGTTPILSDDGRRLLDSARRSLEIHQQLVARPASSRITLGLRHYLLETRIRPRLSQFIDRNPDLDLELRIVDDVTEMANLVSSGEIDAAVYRGDAPSDRSLHAEALQTTECAIYGAPALVRRLKLRGVSLQDAPFLLLPHSRSTGNWLAARLARQGIVPQNVVRRSQFPDLLQQWAKEGKGLCVLMADRETRQAEAGKQIERIGPPLDPVDTLLITKGRYFAQAKIAAFLKSTLDQGD